MSLSTAGFAQADALAAAFARREGQPGLAYGIVAGGALVHSGGLGQRWLGGPEPDAGTVFRIASMTKSFTAAAVLALRDDGALALDDPAERYVPELAGVSLPTADSPPLSLRHLLTMTAGFPADDPWGDRQQGLPLAEFGTFLAGGASFAWAPGTRFEYSNLGYAILGRVITAASGTPYPAFVRDRLLLPLGMTQTGFDPEDFDTKRLARGYRHDGGWSELGFDSTGAFAPMGGILSCVADLARWVGGFAAAFPPGAADGVGEHPLPRATRREMQLPQVATAAPGPVPLPGGPGWGAPVSYGFGLFVEQDAARGRIVQHSGGYPGFGSHMRWRPATGVGVVVLANGTYAAAPELAARMLDAVLANTPPGLAAAGAGEAAAGNQPDVQAFAPAGPWPATLAAWQAASELLRSWDDGAAGRLFAGNVALDSPFAERRRKIALLRERIGDFADGPDRAPEFDSPARCRWWLRGDRGLAQAEIQLNPGHPPRVQSLSFAIPPAPGSPLAGALDSLVVQLNSAVPGWPPYLAASPWLDTAVAVRQLRVAAGWAGRCVPGGFRAGDGETEATLELDGEHARLALTVALAPARHELHHVEVRLLP